MINANNARLIGSYKDTVLVGPEKIEFEVNNRCNLTCAFCWFHSHLNETKHDDWNLEFQKFKEIITDSVPLGTKHITLTAQGEPCLNPDLPQMIRFAKKNNLHVTLTTNLAAKSRKVFRNIGLVDRLEINFSTTNKELYKEIYGPTSRDLFDVVMDNIIELRSNPHQKNQKIFIIFVANKLNIGELDKMVEFTLKNGFDGIQFYLANYGVSYGNKDKRDRLHLSEEEKNKFFNHVKMLKEKYPTAIEDSFLTKGVKKCYMGWYHATVCCHGNVCVGCSDKSFPYAGNVYEQSFHDIWFSDKAQFLRQNFKYHLKSQDFCCPLAYRNSKIEQTLQKMFAGK